MKVRNLPLLCMLLMAYISFNTYAQTIKTPRVPSPSAEVSQTVGISKITVNYSRPSVKDREIWGKLVPYGFTNLGFGTATASPWRAGANENTTITFSHEADIQGQKVPAGAYGLHIAVQEDGTAIYILSENTTSWGSYFYNEKEDVLRTVVTTQEIPMTETLTFNFLETSKNSTVLTLDWEKKRFPLEVSFATDDIVMAKANNDLRGMTGFGWQGPLSAANYALQNNTNIDQALDWADQSINQNKNFQNLFVKASLLKLKDGSSNNMALFDEAAGMANMGQLNYLGYQMLNNYKENEKAIEYFKINVKNNPTNPNVHDSLGEAYKTVGMDKLAIKSLKKSLALNPPPNVKANSLKLLEELGVEDYAGME